MDATANLYTERTALESVLSRALDEGLDNIIEIFKRHVKICVDMTDSEVSSVFMPDNFEKIDIIFTLFDAFGINPPIALKSFFEQIEDQEETIATKPNSLFLKDCSVEKAVGLRNKYGVWVISKDEIANRYFEEPSYEESFEPYAYYGDGNNGWANIITNNNLMLPPSNSMIIYDNHLLDTYRFDHYLGLTNLEHLLDAILPRHLSPTIQYHVLIMAPVRGNEVVLSRVVSKWMEDLPAKLARDFGISIEFVFSKQVIHERMIFLNYAYIKTEKGFKVFMPYSNKVFKDGDEINSVEINTYLNNPHKSGQRKYEFAAIRINRIKDEYRRARENYNNKQNLPGQSKFVGDPTGANFSPNRIFD